jgi:hypothetical protein
MTTKKKIIMSKVQCTCYKYQEDSMGEDGSYVQRNKQEYFSLNLSEIIIKGENNNS